MNIFLKIITELIKPCTIHSGRNFKGIRAGDKSDLTKKLDQVRVWYRWKGYLSGGMENGCWGVASGGIGH